MIYKLNTIVTLQLTIITIFLNDLLAQHIDLEKKKYKVQEVNQHCKGEIVEESSVAVIYHNQWYPGKILNKS